MKRKGGLIAFVLLWIAIPGTLFIALALFAMWPPVAMRFFNLFPTRSATRQTFRDTFEMRGLNPDWIDAIAFVESRWNVNAVNTKGADGARGGAFGATQLTLKTLRGLGYTGNGYDLLGNAGAQADWSAMLMAANNPATFEDAVALWNAGKPYSKLSADSPTVNDYLPKARAALNFVTSIGGYA